MFRWLAKESQKMPDSGAYTGILDWALEHKESQAVQFEMALDFIFLSVLTSKSSSR